MEKQAGHPTLNYSAGGLPTCLSISVRSVIFTKLPLQIFSQVIPQLFLDVNEPLADIL